jgi:hypothetical protein
MPHSANNQQPDDDFDYGFFDINTDLSGFDVEQQSAIRKRLGLPEKQDNGWGELPAEMDRTKFHQEIANLWRDPEVREELSKKQPRWYAGQEADWIDQTIHEFGKQNPDYKTTPKNEATLLKFLVDKHLDGRSYAGDSDRQTLELFQLNAWTVESLQEAYASCLAAGLLDVPEGKPKELTSFERREVIALAQASGPVRAIERYIEIAMSGLPPFRSQSEVIRWRAAHPEICNDASFFIFRQMRPELSEAEIAEIRTELLRIQPIVTLNSIEWFHSKWAEKRNLLDTFATLEATAPPPPQPSDLENLSDDEIADLYRKARLEASRNRR